MSGFYLETSDGTPVHVRGNPKMSQGEKEKLKTIIELAYQGQVNEMIEEEFLKTWTDDMAVGREDAYYWFKAGYMSLARKRDEVEKKKQEFYSHRMLDSIFIAVSTDRGFRDILGIKTTMSEAEELCQRWDEQVWSTHVEEWKIGEEAELPSE